MYDDVNYRHREGGEHFGVARLDVTSLAQFPGIE